VVSADGLIVTTAHAIAQIPLNELMVGLPSDLLVRASVVKVDEDRDLALLATKAEEPLTPLDLSPTTPALGESVVALLVGLNAELRVQIGTVSGLVAQPAIPGVVPGERIGVSLPVEPGASGTPVVDREGRLLGLVQATDSKGTTLLIPAAEALYFVKEANMPANKSMQATASGGA
jgi:S1-C subfamily serine protease